MGRWGHRNVDSDAAEIFFEEDYAPRFLKTHDHDQAWGYYYREWSRLPARTQDEYGVEYLLAVLELWLWEGAREEALRSHGAHLLELVGEEGPRLTRQHPGFLHACAVHALAQLAECEPAPQTCAQALTLVDWSLEAIRRLGLFGGPQSKDGKAAARSLRKLKRDLEG